MLCIRLFKTRLTENHFLLPNQLLIFFFWKFFSWKRKIQLFLLLLFFFFLLLQIANSYRVLCNPSQPLIFPLLFFFLDFSIFCLKNYFIWKYKEQIFFRKKYACVFLWTRNSHKMKKKTKQNEKKNQIIFVLLLLLHTYGHFFNFLMGQETTLIYPLIYFFCLERKIFKIDVYFNLSSLSCKKKETNEKKIHSITLELTFPPPFDWEIEKMIRIDWLNFKMKMKEEIFFEAKTHGLKWFIYMYETR